MASTIAAEGAKRGDLWNIPLSEIIIPKHNPARMFEPPEDVFEAFYQSILLYGQRVPGVVKQLPDKRVELVEGAQRYRALLRKQRETGEPQVFKAVMYTKQNAEEAFRDSVITNKDRIPPTDMDYAFQIRRWMDEFGKSATEVARLYSKSIAWVNQHLEYLSLPERERMLLHYNFFKGETAQVLAKVNPEKLPEVIDRAVEIETAKRGETVALPATAAAVIEHVRTSGPAAARKRGSGTVSASSVREAVRSVEGASATGRNPAMKPQEFIRVLEGFLAEEKRPFPKNSMLFLKHIKGLIAGDVGLDTISRDLRTLFVKREGE